MLSPDFTQNLLAKGDPTESVSDAITELLRTHARTLIAVALEAEVASVVSELKAGGADVIRNGYLPERKVTTAIGDVEVKVPRVRAKDGTSVNFTSTLILKYLRRSKSIFSLGGVMPILRVSPRPTWPVFSGWSSQEGAKKLTPAVVSSLKKEWTASFDVWKKRDLSEITFTYIYADGIYQQIRGDNPKICVLVILGVDDTGPKHLVAVEDGVRESTQSWREVLLDLKSRGMKAPALAVGDEALGFWAAISEVFGATSHQRCWFHKSGNIINHLPKSVQTKARGDLQGIWMAPSRATAEKAITLFREKYQVKYPKAVSSLTKDTDSLGTFYDFPAAYWSHIRTTNAIESTLCHTSPSHHRCQGGIL